MSFALIIENRSPSSDRRFHSGADREHQQRDEKKHITTTTKKENAHHCTDERTEDWRESLNRDSGREMAFLSDVDIDSKTLALPSKVS